MTAVKRVLNLTLRTRPTPAGLRHVYKLHSDSEEVSLYQVDFTNAFTEINIRSTKGMYV